MQHLENDIKYINERLKVLKGRKIRMEYDGKVILEKVDPTAEELLLALYNMPNSIRSNNEKDKS